MLRLLPEMPGEAPIAMRVYPGGHMFYFSDPSRAALHDDAKAVFDPVSPTGGSR
jgi:carboxypeptidase C (cathepsin A)